MEPQIMSEPVINPLSRRLEVEGLLQHEIREIGKSKTKIKELNRALKSRLLTHSGYSQAVDEVKAVQKKRQEEKRKAMSEDTELANLEFELKKETTEKKMRQLSLSDYLLEYKEITGAKSVDDGQGHLFEFEMFAKLKIDKDE